MVNSISLPFCDSGWDREEIVVMGGRHHGDAEDVKLELGAQLGKKQLI
jgi:hypothetical protein